MADDKSIPSSEHLSLFMVEYRVTQLERTSVELRTKMELLATKSDVQELQDVIVKKEDWFRDKLVGPLVVGGLVIAFEMLFKGHP